MPLQARSFRIAPLVGVLVAFVIPLSVPASEAGGPTYISGNIFDDTTWDVSGSPYIVIDNVTVEQSATLTIRSGVMIKFNFLAAIFVDGNLIAVGDQTNPIIFTSNLTPPLPGDWIAIKLNDTVEDSVSRIEFCRIEYSAYGVWLDNSSPMIANNTIMQSLLKAIYLQQSNSAVINNTIAESKQLGVDAVWSGGIVEGNILMNSTDAAISIYHSTIQVVGNIISGGIDGINAFESSVELSYNTISGTGDAISIDSSQAYLSSNILMGNQRGISLAMSDDAKVLDHTIVGNQRAFFAVSSNASMTNSTLDSELFDFHLQGSSNVETINTTFNGSKLLISSSSTLTVKNYLHVRVEDLDGLPLPDADVEVKDNDLIIYEFQTDDTGMCEWILITDRIYFSSSIPTENSTIGTVSYNALPFFNNSRDIDMSTTHTEIFTEATAPITPPIITQVMVQPTPQRIGGAVNISVTVTDNTQVYGVWVDIRTPNNNLLGNFSMEYDSTKGHYYYDATYFIMGTYSFTIWANNTFDKWSYSAGSFTIKDFTPPMIEFINFPSPKINKQTNISVWVTDNVGVNEVLLYYKNIDDDSYSFIEMQKISEGVYEAAIPPQNKAGDFYFYISANDTSANEVTTDKYTLFIGESIETRPSFNWAIIIVFALDVFAFILILFWFTQRRKERSVTEGS